MVLVVVEVVEVLLKEVVLALAQQVVLEEMV